MNKKKMILSICLGILAVMLLTSVGSAAPAQESAYVHVIHYYDGIPVGMTDDEMCHQNDIIYWEQGNRVSFSNMIQTTYNGRSYTVNRIELHDELANLEILLLRNGNYPPGFAETDFNPSMELSRGTETIVINSNLPDEPDIRNLFSLSCSSVHITTWPPNTPTNIRKITDVWMTYSLVAAPGNNNGQTGLYPLTGEITYPQQRSSLKSSTGDDSWIDITNPGDELSNGGHYVLKIFYSSAGGQSSGGNNFRVTFYPNDGGNPIVKVFSKGAYASVPTEFAGRNAITGWYLDDGSFANAWNFETDKVTQEMSLYARSSSAGGDRTNGQGAEGQGTSGPEGDGTGGQGATPNPNPNQNDDQNPPGNTRLLMIIGIIALLGLIVIGIYMWNKNKT